MPYKSDYLIPLDQKLYRMQPGKKVAWEFRTHVRVTLGADMLCINTKSSIKTVYH